MQVSATMAPAVGQTVIATSAAVVESSLVVRTLTAAGTAIAFLATAAERCGVFGAGFFSGFVMTKNWEDSLKIAAITFVAFSCLNVLKCVAFGPSAFVYGALADTMLGCVGFTTGFVAGVVKNY